MNQDLVYKVESFYNKTFGRKPDVLVFSPGRINLIGEHVDYNGGVVLPAAIDKAIYIALSPSSSNSSIYALDIQDSLVFNVNEIKSTKKVWQNYILGIVNELRKEYGFDNHFNAVFSGNIPIGAGLSSSAALSCGFLYGLNKLYKLKISKQRLALISQKADQTFVGVKSGIMDQFTNLHGKSNHFIYLDTRNLSFSYFDINLGDYVFQLYNSNISHELANSEYNARRESCEYILSELKKMYPQVSSLRDCSHEMLYFIKEHVERQHYEKAKYVIDEILRVIAASKALNSGDIEALGELLNETHKGLRDLYKVSCKEVDFLQRITLEQEGVIGSRIMGGGFGGCTLNIIKKDLLEEVNQKVKNEYLNKYNIELTPISVQIFNGTYCIY